MTEKPQKSRWPALTLKDLSARPGRPRASVAALRRQQLSDLRPLNFDRRNLNRRELPRQLHSGDYGNLKEGRTEEGSSGPRPAAAAAGSTDQAAETEEAAAGMERSVPLSLARERPGRATPSVARGPGGRAPPASDSDSLPVCLNSAQLDAMELSPHSDLMYSRLLRAAAQHQSDADAVSNGC